MEFTPYQTNLSNKWWKSDFIEYYIKYVHLFIYLVFSLICGPHRMLNTESWKFGVVLSVVYDMQTDHFKNNPLYQVIIWAEMCIYCIKTKMFQSLSLSLKIWNIFSLSFQERIYFLENGHTFKYDKICWQRSNFFEGILSPSWVISNFKVRTCWQTFFQIDQQTTHKAV